MGPQSLCELFQGTMMMMMIIIILIKKHKQEQTNKMRNQKNKHERK